MKTIEQRIKDLEQKMQAAVRVSPGGSAVAAARLSVGGGAAIQQITKYSFVYTPGTIGAQSAFTATFPLLGLNVGDVVIVNPPGGGSAPMSQAWVPNPNTLAIVFVNATTAAQTPPSGTYYVIAIRA